jgi:hypothetical protein
MVELIDEFHFGLDALNPIQTFHLAEGPGGFIEAVVNYRKNIKHTRTLSLGNKDGLRENCPSSRDSSPPNANGHGLPHPSNMSGSHKDVNKGIRSTSPKEAMYANGNDGDDIYVGMTLLVPLTATNTEPMSTFTTPASPLKPTETAEMPPNWKKIHSFLKDNQNNVIIEKGVDKTGNILSLSNFIKINETYGNTMDFITADGGFDFSADFSNQEINAIQLIYGQIIFALCMQKQGGSFVLKIFDCFMKSTVELIALLCSVYDNVYITKPNTSRSANSEKYIVCKGFNHSSVQLYPYLFFSFKEMLEKRTTAPRFVGGFLNTPLPQYFIQKLEKYNGILGEKQLENMEKTLAFIHEDENTDCWKRRAKNSGSEQLKWRNATVNRYDTVVWNKKRERYLEGGGDVYYKKEQWVQNSKEIDTLVNSNILKSLHWCIKHNIPT